MGVRHRCVFCKNELEDDEPLRAGEEGINSLIVRDADVRVQIELVAHAVNADVCQVCLARFVHLWAELLEGKRGFGIVNLSLSQERRDVLYK